MADLATIDDLADVMRRDLDTADAARAGTLLRIASQRVRTYTGSEFLAATSTVTLRVRNRKARLPQWPVTAVSSVTDINDNAVTFEWDGLQIIELGYPVNSFEIEGGNRRLGTVKATYTHGADEVPDDVIGIVCDMVAAALDSPPEDVGVQSETVGPFQASYGSQYPGGVRLTQSMKDALAPYCINVGTAKIS